jgi:hypothetical protein
MNCEQASEFLPEYWGSTLEAVPRRELLAHLESCPACRAEAARLKTFWLRLGAIPDEMPAAAARGRFEAMLADYRHAVRRGRIDAFLENWWPRRPVAQAACALGMLIAGLVVGLLGGHALTLDVQERGEVARLRNEVASTRQLVALSLLQEPSASQRLKGVDWSGQLPQAQPQVVNALLETVNYDDTVDVRLAAVDALRRWLGEAEVRAQLAGALQRQDSPLVQIALIDALSDSRSPQAVAAIRRVAELKTIDPAVRAHAEASLEKMQ